METTLEVRLHEPTRPGNEKRQEERVIFLFAYGAVKLKRTLKRGMKRGQVRFQTKETGCKRRGAGTCERRSEWIPLVVEHCLLFDGRSGSAARGKSNPIIGLETIMCLDQARLTRLSGRSPFKKVKPKTRHYEISVVNRGRTDDGELWQTARQCVINLTTACDLVSSVLAQLREVSIDSHLIFHLCDPSHLESAWSDNEYSERVTNSLDLYDGVYDLFPVLLLFVGDKNGWPWY